MKKIVWLGLLINCYYSTAQISLQLQSTPTFADQEVYLYGFNGSKDILMGREKTNHQGTLSFSSKEAYVGMMKAYFPEKNFTLRFVTEKKPVRVSIAQDNSVIFHDEANEIMNTAQAFMQKKEVILPALTQIAEYYEPLSEFGKALDKEVHHLSTAKMDTQAYPFISFYLDTFTTYAKQGLGKGNKLKAEDYISFVNKANPYLENSGLLRSILINYLNISGKTPDHATDELMEVLQYESSRGQTVLSEFIDIFDAYGMKEIKQKYLSHAQNLKCTINDRLANTIKANKETSVGATIANYTFVNPINTKEKTLHDVKADKKVIVFWSSSCTHCQTDLPKILEKYPQMKQKKIEVIGLSIDVNKSTYEQMANMHPWISASELRGWNSSFISTYNVHGTPAYYVVDDKNKIISVPETSQDLLQFLGL